MSVVYIQTLKDTKGMMARWHEILGNYSFTISHAKVVTEDYFSRCPEACREPTPEEQEKENLFEEDPIPEQDLEQLAATYNPPGARQEMICSLQPGGEKKNKKILKKVLRLETTRTSLSL